MSSGYFDWETAYGQYHNRFPGYKKQPVIGITGNFGEKGCELAEGYFESVLKAGATPVIIPPFEDRDALANVLEHIDGLLLSGGGDLNPLFTDEEPIPQLHSVNYKRDLAELLLIRLAYDRQIPMLGICRGIQMLTVALGGSVYQDIYSQQPDRQLLGHDQQLDRRYASHTIQPTADSLVLRRLLGEAPVAVNSFHHQAVKETGPLLRVCATSPDGLIEAVESAEYKSVLGVQWHPECFILRQDESMMPLFRWLCEEAGSFREAKALHRKMLTLDSHCDTPMFFHKGIHFDQRDPNILVFPNDGRPVGCHDYGGLSGTRRTDGRGFTGRHCESRPHTDTNRRNGGSPLYGSRPRLHSIRFATFEKCRQESHHVGHRKRIRHRERPLPPASLP